jgi:RNA polymerase primary sigma factor
MPRLPSLKLEPIQDLLEQLRFAPRETSLAQLARAEQVAGELDPDETYPHSYIVFRLTGYRSDADRTEDYLYAGEALRRDLGILIERVSDAIGITEEELGSPTLTVSALRERWSVSQRSIDRYRRSGLIGHRVRDTSGRVRLAFTMRQIERFEEERADTLVNARRFTRIEPDLRRRMIERARRYHDWLGYNLNQSAARLSNRFDRGHETIRQLLARHDAQHPDDAIFADIGPLRERDRRVIHRAWRLGIDVDRLGERYRRSRSSIHRALAEARAGALRELDLSGPTSPLFLHEDAESVILAPAAVTKQLLPDHLERLGDVLNRVAQHDLPPADVEQAQCAALHYLRFLAAGEIAALARHQPSVRAIDRIETRLRWASRVKAAIITSHLRLVVQTIDRYMGRPLAELPPDDVPPLMDLAVGAIADAVDRHDVFKGGRLAAPAGLLLTRRLAEQARRPAASLARARTEHVSALLRDWRFDLDPWQAWLEPSPRARRIAMAGHTALPEGAAAIFSARYGLDGHPPMTNAALAVAHQMHAARLVRLERSVLRVDTSDIR